MKRRIRAALALVIAVILFSGCQVSREYRFYPDDNSIVNSSVPQNIQCGHIDLVLGSVGPTETHIEVGRFCRENSNGR